jgi:hypothetical protein
MYQFSDIIVAYIYTMCKDLMCNTTAKPIRAKGLDRKAQDCPNFLNLSPKLYLLFSFLFTFMFNVYVRGRRGELTQKLT